MWTPQAPRPATTTKKPTPSTIKSTASGSSFDEENTELIVCFVLFFCALAAIYYYFYIYAPKKKALQQSKKKMKPQINGPPPRPANNPLPPLLGKRARDVDIVLHPPPEPRKRCTSQSIPLKDESDEWEEKKRDQRRGILKREKATLKTYHAATSAPKDSARHGYQHARIKDHSVEIKKTPCGSKDRKVGKPKFNEPADLRKSMRRSEEVKKFRSKDPAALRKYRSMCRSEEVKKSRSKDPAALKG